MAPFVYGPARPITVQDYREKKCVSFTLTDLLYMMTMLHMVEAQQSQYSLAQADVTLFAFGVLGSLIFDEPTRSSNSPIP